MKLQSTRYGIRNLIRYFPVIWRQRDYDWDGLAELMELRLRHMAEMQERDGSLVNSNRYAKQMRVCSELLRRLRTDEYRENRNGARDDLRYLGLLIGKHMYKWWD